MQTYGNSATATDTVPANGTHTQPPQAFTRVLVPIQDATQVERLTELARGAGATQARVLHLNLHENISGRRFSIETQATASQVAEAAVLELSMAGIETTGQVRRAVIDKAADAIIAEATQWGADLIVLGTPRRGELATRLLGSITLRVLAHAPCPVLIASATSTTHPHQTSHTATPVTA
jgi:nucleotide-binding universal stress UspA family protein